ncbi:MAG: 5-formyltetrahydrofolate cyclo-ligase [Thermoguttaceae bacterium]|jgi:5-formyltetrahydrofolate cyclo-ligase
MENNLPVAKKRLRSAIKARLAALSLDRREAAMKLYENLLAMPRVADAKTICVFVDFGNEMETRYFIPCLFDGPGFTRVVGVPFCVGKIMRFYKLERPTLAPESHEPVFRDLAASNYGILEPTLERQNSPQHIVAPEDIDVMLTPGLAFDLQGRRLGRGAGYYDRYLPQLRRDAFIVGIGYEEQLVEETPAGELDFRVHAVVTPVRSAICNI